MNNNLKILLGLTAVLALYLILFQLPFFLKETSPKVCISEGTCKHEEEMNFLIALSPFLVALGFVLGAAAFYFITENKKTEVIEKKPSKDALLTLLSQEERRVVAKIVEEGGKALQSEISFLKGVGKVRAHRLIERLEARGVVEKEEHGKTRLIKLRKEVKELFL